MRCKHGKLKHPVGRRRCKKLSPIGRKGRGHKRHHSRRRASAGQKRLNRFRKFCGGKGYTRTEFKRCVNEQSRSAKEWNA